MLSDHRYTAIFGAALLTASGATFAVYRLIGTAARPQREPVRAVVVAVRDVPVGMPIPREALGIAAWPARVAPAESYAVADSVVGRVTRTPLVSGEPVLSTRLAVRGAAPGLEGAIDPARRAMAVRVNEAASLSGLVRANSRVDVLMAARGEGPQAGPQVAHLLMSDVRVLGVGSVRPPETPASADPAPAPAATTAAIVTLEVTPAQAGELAAAESQGAIQVVLRGYGSEGDARGLAPMPALDDPTPLPAAGAGAPGFVATSGVGPVAPARPAIAPAATPARPRASDVPRREARPERARVAQSRPESTVVYVYRGGAMTVLHMGVTGPVSPTPASATVSAPASPAAEDAHDGPRDATRDGNVRAVRTADARVGPHAP